MFQPQMQRCKCLNQYLKKSYLEMICYRNGFGRTFFSEGQHNCLYSFIAAQAQSLGYFGGKMLLTNAVARMKLLSPGLSNPREDPSATHSGFMA